MLAFITSLRHPDNSADYGRVEELLRDTLTSVTNQTSDDYVVIVVGNRKPAFDLPPRVHFLPVDFPAPAPPTGPRTAREPFVWDKGTKIGAGLAAAASYDPDHVMIFDADDFVSSRIVEYITTRPENEVHVVRDGIMYSRRRNVFLFQSDFNRTCGTSFVVPFSAYGVPDSLTPSATQGDIAGAFGERLTRIMGAHRDAHAWFADAGYDVIPVPFLGAAYHVDTGENHSGKSLRGFARPLSRDIAHEFGITPTKPALSSRISAYGPAAAYESALMGSRALASKVYRAAFRRDDAAAAVSLTES